MKAFATIGLAASVAANVAMVAALCLDREPRGPAAGSRPRDAGREPHASVVSSQVPVDSDLAGVPAVGSRAAEAGTNDGELALPFPSADLHALVAGLRSAGFPVAAVRAIAREFVDEHSGFAARRLEILGPMEPAPYWKARSRVENTKPQRLRMLELEQRAVLRELLGEDAISGKKRRELNASYGNFSDEKLDRLEWIDAAHAEGTSRLRPSWRKINEFVVEHVSLSLPWDDEAVTRLDRERRESIEQALMPDELFEYDLRTSSIARTLRRKLSLFEPTEQEFRALYQVQCKLEEPPELSRGSSPSADARARQQPGNGAQDELAKRRAAELRFREALDDETERMTEWTKAVLGEARYADYLLAEEHGYALTRRVTDRFRLPKETARSAYELQKETWETASEINHRADLGAGARAEALRVLADRAEIQLGVLLGDRAGPAYEQVTGGWLRALDRAGMPPSTPTGTTQVYTIRP